MEWAAGRFAGAVMILSVASVSGEAAAGSIVTVHSDGNVSVRIGGTEPLTIPAPAAGLLRSILKPGADPRRVEDVLAGDACIGATDARLASAVAAYALSLVPEQLSSAVVLGVLRCNPAASEDIEVAAGLTAPLTAPRGSVGSVEPGPLGGIGGGGSQELARGGSPSRL